MERMLYVRYLRRRISFDVICTVALESICPDLSRNGMSRRLKEY